ncbi:MAG: hypothetical protein DRH76_08530 [Deltaproteobacteria bacterium]|nr:MAG: hypothetical protein DRH76_08530 [Deltaproteobacteria bacterium]
MRPLVSRCLTAGAAFDVLSRGGKITSVFDISYRLSVIGYWLSVIGYWLSVIGYWLSEKWMHLNRLFR